MEKNLSSRTQKMVQLAILVAIMLIFAYTPLGYLKVGAIEITFMVLPVAIGAILLGPVCGAILGGLFGLTSFIQCFGASPFGALLLSLNPITTFITCCVRELRFFSISKTPFPLLPRLCGCNAFVIIIYSEPQDKPLFAQPAGSFLRNCLHEPLLRKCKQLY